MSRHERRSVATKLFRSRWHSEKTNQVVSESYLDQASFVRSFSNVIPGNVLILWSGRPGSNRRRPAWEKGRQLYLKHLFVSGTLIRLTQALAVSTTSFLQPCNRGTNEVHSNVLLTSMNMPDIPWARNRDRGKSRDSPPPTPPDMRVRIRRFGWLGNRRHSQSRNPKRVEVSIGQRDAERGRVRQTPGSMSATGRFSGQISAHTPLA